MNKTLKTVLGTTALALSCHAPATLAAYAFASADAALKITGGSGYELVGVELTPSASHAAVGDALTAAEGDVLLLANGVFVSGTASADALFPPASAASAGYSSTQPLFVFNTSGAANTLEFNLDWNLTVNALNDFLAPQEIADATVTVSLQQIVGGVSTELFSESALTTIANGEFADMGSFVFSYQLAANEFTSFLVGINATSYAETVVPLPTSVLLLAPALGLLVLRRRSDA